MRFLHKRLGFGKIFIDYAKIIQNYLTNSGYKGIISAYLFKTMHNLCIYAYSGEIYAKGFY